VPDRDPLHDIATPRLILRVLLPAVDAALSGDVPEASRRLKAAIPDDLVQDPQVLKLARSRLAADSGYGPWAPRAMILRDANRMIGHIGFHTAPDPEYLHPFARAAVEVGYTVFEDWRRRGYAREALAAIMAWATREHGVSNFIASVSPDNLASLAVIRGFQFAKVGAHIDEEDGPEDIFLRRLAALDQPPSSDAVESRGGASDGT
jgi:[ribosomal protein S5]-alanine N-acetyltransferase